MADFDSDKTDEMQRIRKEVAGWTKTALGKRKSPRVHIGTNTLSDRDVWVNDDQRAIHMHVLGRSGQGKTYLLESMIRSDIDNGRGLCLIDPHGDLYERIVKYCVRKRLQKRVILIDPSDTEWAVGLNYLEYNSDIYDAPSHASQVMKGIAKVFGGEKTETMPRLQRWERNALIPLISSQLTLIELHEFLNTRDPTFRHAVLEQEDNFLVGREWELFEGLKKFDQDMYSDSVLNRANKFAVSNKLRRMFGQRTSTIDFRKAIDEKKIILCNLNSGILPDEEWKMLGVVIIDKIYQAGRSRGDIAESRRKRMPPYYFYIDEFGELVTDDISKALQELRKFKISLVLAHQELEQLRENSPKLYSAVMAEPDIKVTFSVSREDAEVMAKSLFTGKFRGDVRKLELEQTKFRPVESTREVRSRTKGGGSSGGTSSTTSSGTAMTFGAGEVHLPDGGVGSMSQSHLRGTSSTTSSGLSSSSSESWGESTTEVPFYEYEEFTEVSSVQFYSIEEMHEKFISWIANQSPMHAQLKIGTRNPIPIVTPWVEDVKVREKDVRRFKEEIYGQYARPVEEVDEEIEGRVLRFVESDEFSGRVVDGKAEVVGEVVQDDEVKAMEKGKPTMEEELSEVQPLEKEAVKVVDKDIDSFLR